MTADLLALDDWLRSHGVEVIAMESTGVISPLLANIAGRLFGRIDTVASRRL
jgi:hypothetical protein